MLKPVFYDDAKGKYITGTSSFSRAEEVFIVTNPAGQTDFQLVANLGASQIIDVLLNGADQDEGGSSDFTRDDENDKIIFNSTIPKDAKVKVRLYS